MSTEDKLADIIRWAAEECVPHADKAHHVAVEVRERFVVIDRDKVQRQVDTVMEYDAASPYPGEDGRYPSIKSGAAHVNVRAGASHARDMAVHYLALAQWIDEHPPVDEEAVRELTAFLDKEGLSMPNDGLAWRLVKAGWKRGGVS